MIQVDLTGIHRIMTKYYGSRHMKMDTIVESRHFIRPKELKITFDYDPLCHVDMLRLHRRLGRYIDGVREFFFVSTKTRLKYMLFCIGVGSYEIMILNLA